MPGVLIVEAMRAGRRGRAALAARERGQASRFFGGIDKVRFKRQVRPGDTLRMECTITKRRGPIGFGDGEGVRRRRARLLRRAHVRDKIDRLGGHARPSARSRRPRTRGTPASSTGREPMTNMALEQRLADGSAVLGVVGLGYVGLPLAVEMAKAGHPRHRLRRDARSKVAQVNAGESYIPDVPTDELARARRRAGLIAATTDFSRVGRVRRDRHLRADAARTR